MVSFTLAHFSSVERAYGTHQIGDWVCPRAALAQWWAKGTLLHPLLETVYSTAINFLAALSGLTAMTTNYAVYCPCSLCWKTIISSLSCMGVKRPTRKRNDNIRMNLEERARGRGLVLDSSSSRKFPVEGSCRYGNRDYGSIKEVEFIDQLRDYQLLKNSAPLSQVRTRNALSS
jgi:hypothetical protein